MDWQGRLLVETRDSHTQEGKLLDLLERYALE